MSGEKTVTGEGSRTKSFRKKKKFVTRKNVVRQVSNLKKAVSQIQKMPELKAVDRHALSAMVVEGTALGLNLVGQGDTLWQRTGNSIRLKTVSFRWYIISGIQATLCRIMLIYDKQPNSAAIVTATDVLMNVDSLGTASTTAYPNHHMNLGNKDRFKVLYDWQGISPGSVQSFKDPDEYGYSQEPNDKFYRKLGNRKVQWLTSNTTQGTIPQSGNLFVFFSSTVPTAAATINKPFLDWDTRVRYVDE